MGKKKQTNQGLDRLTAIIGICMPFVTLPQLFAIIYATNLQGVSFWTWAFYTLQAGVFALFAIKNKQKPLIFTYIPLFVVEFMIVCVLIVRTF